ncbi:MAG: two-component sensor histidine kinase [Mesorhizobium amorphae]|nr:MAG: two-component sensor histidine kinase [Mesorhizobium amorphae]
MAPERSGSPDKNIVDRTQAHRNSEVAKTVRRTRDRLSQQAGSPTYDRELLKIHASAVTGAGLAVPVLVAAVTVALVLAGMGKGALLWALVTLACHAVLLVVANRVKGANLSQFDPVRLRHVFLLAHGLGGLGWAYFAILPCAQCGVAQFPVIKATVMLVAMAATALMTHALRGALFATFALPVAAYAAFGADYGLVADAAMAGLLVASLPFFAHVAGHLHRSSLLALSFRGEKDVLIAELETASAMSEEARRRAEEANLAKSRFLASMSHELRTPLNAILGFSEVMSSEVLGPMQNPTYRDYAHDIHQSGQHLLGLINEILDLSRIEAGRYQLNEEALTFADVAEECCRLIELKARHKDLRIIRQFEANMPRVLADERALRQIALNLLSNAVKFAPSGGEIVVRVGWTAGGGQYLSVRDWGPGIPPEEIPVVLSVFGQGSIAIKSAEQGTGLGLPIVQGLVNMHGGDFELRSKLREGTEAIAILPASRVLEALPALPTETAARRR